MQVDSGSGKFDFIYYQVIVPLLFCSVTVVGVAGNTLVIYVVFFKKVAHTATNLLLLNLAIADLSFVVICPPFTAYRYALVSWRLGGIACKLMHYLLNVTVYVTIYTLVAIAVVRYMTIVYSYQTKHMRTKRNIIFVCVGIWALFSICNLPIVFLYDVIEDSENNWVDCEKTSEAIGKPLYVTFFVFAYLLPLFVIGLLSIGMVCHIRHKRQAHHSTNVTICASYKRKRHVTRLVIAVVAIFAILWLPIHVHLLLLYSGHLNDVSSEYESVSVFWNVLAYINSCIDPLIYTIASQEFRNSFRCVLCCWSSPGKLNKLTTNDNSDSTCNRNNSRPNGSNASHNHEEHHHHYNQDKCRPDIIPLQDVNNASVNTEQMCDFIA